MATEPETTPVFDTAIAWLDTETTHLNPEIAQVLEIALVIPKTGLRWSTKVQPTDISLADPKALEINGYNETDWIGAPTAVEAFTEMLALLKAARVKLIGGQNIGFDMSVIGCQMRRLGLEKEWRSVPHRTVDTISLAYAALGHELPLLNLQSICTALGVSNDGAHRALADVDRTIAVHDLLMQRLRPDRFRG